MRYLIIIPFVLSMLSCTVEEGEGGQGEITGRVFIQEKRDFSAAGGPSDSVINEYPAIDERVYIKYGDNEIYDDDFDTDEKGFFKFTGLTKGKYTVFTYTYCPSCDAEVKPIYQTVELKKHKSAIEGVNFFIEED